MRARSRSGVTDRCRTSSSTRRHAPQHTRVRTEMRVAVAGGTGVVGRHVVASLRAAGVTPVILARSAGVDITSGAGLDVSLRDVDALVDVSNTRSGRKKSAIEFFEAGTTRLLQAGERAGVRRHVILSIVGADR